MPRGGSRPGAGRKPDPEKKAAREAAAARKAAKAAEKSHGYTAQDGTKADDAPAGWPFGIDPELAARGGAPAAPPPPPPAVPSDPKRVFKTPLEYWEHVLADPEASASAKHAAAFSMAPYVHPKLAPLPKKDQGDKGKAAKPSRFGQQAAPTLAAVNGQRV